MERNPRLSKKKTESSNAPPAYMPKFPKEPPNPEAQSGRRAAPPRARRTRSAARNPPVSKKTPRNENNARKILFLSRKNEDERSRHRKADTIQIPLPVSNHPPKNEASKFPDKRAEKLPSAAKMRPNKRIPLFGNKILPSKHFAKNQMPADSNI